MRLSDAVVLAVGVATIAWAMVDVFQSVIVPRAPTVTYRISILVWRGLWRLWPPLSRFFYRRKAAQREEFLAIFAPFALIAMILAWVVVLVLGYGAIFWALRNGLSPPARSYAEAAYFAGTSLLTIGFGDMVARQGFARFVSLCAGATGLAVFAITTAYLFAIFGTFQRRESFIVTFAARAGSPPSGVGLFEIAAKTSTQKSVDALMHDAQDWIASLMESHLAYPVLAYFRSSHDDQSWVSTLGALLDTSLLANTVLDDGEHGEARICLRIARHAVHDLSGFFGMESRGTRGAGIERADFDRACDRLLAAGYRIRDRDAGWHDFSRMRAEYAGTLGAMASFFKIPTIEWIGARRAPHSAPDA